MVVAPSRALLRCLLAVAGPMLLLLALLSSAASITAARADDSPQDVSASASASSADSANANAANYAAADEIIKVSAAETDEFNKLLDSFTTESTSQLRKTFHEHQILQKKIDTRLSSIHSVQAQIQAEINGFRAIMEVDKYEDTELDRLKYDIDETLTRLARFKKRHLDAQTTVGNINRKALKGELGKKNAADIILEDESGGWEDVVQSAEENKEIPLGLKDRLRKVLKQELARRDRYDAALEKEVGLNKVVENIANVTVEVEEEEIIEEEEEEGGEIEEEEETTTPAEEEAEEAIEGNKPSPYINLTQLTNLLSPQTIITPTETSLKKSLGELANEVMQQHSNADNVLWKERQAYLPKYFEGQYDKLDQKVKHVTQEAARINSAAAAAAGNNQCVNVPTAMEMAATALQEHYYDGTTNSNLVDHAIYENGGSVVYELTSSAYVPPARNNGASRNRRMEVERQKQKMFDASQEEMYHLNRAMLTRGPDGTVTLMDQLSDAWERLNVWEWFTAYKFDNMRPYLPEDWERVLDTASTKMNQGGNWWSDFTPRGAIDALVPDYVHHMLGMSNSAAFGAWFGSTASPEVAISGGYDKTSGSADGGGWSAKPLGQCYPLSMSSSDDPALSLLSQQQGGMMEDYEDEVDNSLLIGPKYTVRLPYPVHVDAVTLEHRSFPLPRSELESGKLGGESAPRWVRVVGFPPCPEKEEEVYDDDEDGADEEDECRQRGFDISKPIDLGSFEYQRITVTGREDDYGGSMEDDDDDEDGGSNNGNDAWPSERRRSIQTFAVKGGKYKHTSLLDKVNASKKTSSQFQYEEYDAADPRQCSEESGSCEAPTDYEEEEEAAAATLSIPEPEEEDSMPMAGQCAPPKDEDSEPSCGDDTDTTTTSSTTSSYYQTSRAQQRQIVEAVSFIIEENWGNGDYTCLYRVRVHGDAVLS